MRLAPKCQPRISETCSNSKISTPINTLVPIGAASEMPFIKSRLTRGGGIYAPDCMTSTAFLRNLQQLKHMNRRTQKSLSAHDVHQRRWASLPICGGGAIICILPCSAT